jgi:hypothetical protein
MMEKSKTTMCGWRPNVAFELGFVLFLLGVLVFVVFGDLLIEWYKDKFNREGQMTVDKFLSL